MKSMFKSTGWAAGKGAALLLASSFGAGVVAPAAAIAQEITVTVRHVRALDKIDATSKADFYARVTIAGETFRSEHIQDNDDIRPNWTFTKRVPAGVHDVKLEIVDKDVAVDDVVDINRVTGKRDLDFKVDTRSCSIQGFSEPYSCGSAIVRAGTERKRASVTFIVNVR